MAGGGSSDGDFGLQIAPMLDILFVLLLFFMVAAGSQKHEASIATQLPGSSPGKFVPVQITIDADGQVNINNAATDGTTGGDDLPETISRLKGIDRQQREPAGHHHPAAQHDSAAGGRCPQRLHRRGVKNLAFGSSS